MSTLCVACGKETDPITYEKVGGKIICKECYDALPNGIDISKPMAFNQAVLIYKNQNKMNTENRIPFDIEKWETENYEAVYRNGEKPLDILISKLSIEWPIFSINNKKNSLKHHTNGMFHFFGEDVSDYDLFLIPKKKKGYVVVYENNGYIDSSVYIDYNTMVTLIGNRLNKGSNIVHEAEFEY